MKSLINSSSACISLILLITLLPLHTSQTTNKSKDADTKIQFPNLLAPELRKIRLQYELNNYHIDNENLIQYQSALLDEAYSINRGTARVINYRNGESKGTSSGYDVFYWMRQDKLQDSIWLKPFICINSTLSIEDQPMICSAIKELFPKFLSQYLVYTINPGTRLFGLSSILAHVSKDPRLQWFPEINLWQLKLEDNLTLEFKMANQAAKQPTNTMNSLIGFQVDIEMKNRFRLQISILQADSEFLDSLLEWPVEYGCRLILNTPEHFNPTALQTSSRTEYELEVSVVMEDTTSLPKKEYTISALPPHRPKDTMNNPIVHMTTMRIVHDIVDSIIALDQEDRLHVWNLDERLMFHVDKNRDTCFGPLEISKHYVADSDSTPENLAQYCSEESIEVNLSPNLVMKLNGEALSLLQFYSPDMKNLVRAKLIEEGLYELTFEYQFKKLCLFLNDKLVSDSMKKIRVFRRFTYNSNTNELAPRTTSILHFTDSDCSRLLMQLDLNLIVAVAYQPWIKSRNLIDLSSCSRGPKESALLTVEYPVAERWAFLEHIDKPHQLIRQSVAQQMHSMYKMSQLRIPKIGVHIEENLVKVHMRLLERTPLYIYSSYLPVLNVIRSSYQNWLRRATHSVLVGDIVSCADYCEQYSCLVYVYCKTMQSCFIFKDASFGSALGGSFEEPGMSCEARHVNKERFGDDSMLWATKKSWSLEEIIEDIEESFETPELGSELIFKKIPKLSLTMISRYRNNQMLSRIIRLEPQYVHHQYDLDLGSNSLDGYALHGAKSERIIRSNFALILSGWTFETRLESQLVDLDKPDLKFSSGYWKKTDIPLTECVQLCLQDSKCLTLSYCTTAKPLCFLTHLNTTNILSILNEKEFPKGGQENEIGLEQNDACAVMRRTFLDQFKLFDEQPEPQLYVPELLDILEVDSDEDCATGCMVNRLNGTSGRVTKNVCLSFSYCESGEPSKKSNCFLFETHLITEPARFSNNNSTSIMRYSLSQNEKVTMCQHYVRQFLADFIRQSKRKIPEKFVSSTLSNFEQDKSQRDNSLYTGIVSVDHCAKLCDKDENCGAFDYCSSDNPEAPHGLHLSCSLGSSETLQLLPEATRKRAAFRAVNSSLDVYLEKSSDCEVYLYKSKSLVLNHKKRNLTATESPAEQPTDQYEQVAPVSRLIYADMMFFGMFFFFSAFWNEQRGSLRFPKIKFSRLLSSGGVSNDQQQIELLQQEGNGNNH